MDTLFFSGEKSPLSNLYHFTLWIGGILYQSTEHYYQESKALHFGEKETAKRIKHARTSRDAMRMGRRLPKNDDRWEEKRMTVMLHALTMKYNQCDRYREELGRYDIFVEDTNNEFWGRGQHNTGNNALGLLHHHVKQESQRWMIAGDSHTRDMDTLMKENYLTPHVADIITRPGGTIQDLHRVLKRTNLSRYTHILICIGSNNIYTKQGKTHTQVSQILKLLNEVHTYITQNTTAQITFIAPLPKAKNTRMTWHKETLRAHNRVVRYIHKKVSFGLVSTRDFMTKDIGNGSYFVGDGVHLNRKGKVFLLKKCF